MTSTTVLSPAPPVAATRSSSMFPSATVRHESPIGRLHIESRFDTIVRLDIEGGGHVPSEDGTATATPLLDEARRQLDDYFAGRRRRFDLPFEQIGTPFQAEVWARLGDVAWGTATTYGELADLVDRPSGARAIGGAIRANRIAVLVPCHRVLGSGRTLTGYSPGQGIATKRWLLEHEGIEFKE